FEYCSLTALKLGASEPIDFNSMALGDNTNNAVSSSIALYLNGKEYEQANKETNEWKGMKWLAILPYETEK
ncbi:MAG: hypothetical protein MI784_05280, partial [Cytophagales bacterium]|nr:hypothetical protein [Cytophagales bacterium]